MIIYKCWVKTYMLARPTSNMKKGWLYRTSCGEKNEEIAPFDWISGSNDDNDDPVMIQWWSSDDPTLMKIQTKWWYRLDDDPVMLQIKWWSSLDDVRTLQQIINQNTRYSSRTQNHFYINRRPLRGGNLLWASSIQITSPCLPWPQHTLIY